MSNRLLAAAIATCIVSILTVFPASADTLPRSPRQAQVEQRSTGVMPFDMNRTMHMFTPSKNGGVQTVMSTDGDPHQIGLIRSHLRKEARAFARGNYADPASIHGMNMPGLAQMRAGTRHIAVRYANSENGGTITFATSDSSLIAAIHRWFAAQVNDHGAHAMMMH